MISELDKIDISTNVTDSFYSLQIDNITIRGRRGSLHFIRFPTSEMGSFLSLARSRGMGALLTTVCATGGGAYKFEDDFKRVSSNFSIYVYWKRYLDCFRFQRVVQCFLNIHFTEAHKL